MEGKAEGREAMVHGRAEPSWMVASRVEMSRTGRQECEHGWLKISFGV